MSAPASNDKLIRISLETAGQDHLKGFRPFREEPTRIAKTIATHFPHISIATIRDIVARLRNYAQCEWSDNILEGTYIRYIRTGTGTPTLTQGGIVVDIDDTRIHLKSSRGNRLWYIAITDALIFRRLAPPEWIILAALHRAQPPSRSAPAPTDPPHHSTGASNNRE